MKEKQSIKILFVEDLPVDAELARREISRAGIEFTSKLVDTEPEFKAAINTFDPDIIISDYSMPTFDGMSALKITRDLQTYIPFIVLTGSMNEETAVACMKAGANDYVIKEQIKRLPFAVLEAIEKNRIRKEKELMQQQLHKSLQEYQDLINGMNETVWIIHPDGTLLDVNNRAVEVLGYSRDELLEIGIYGIDSHLNREKIIRLVKSMETDKTQLFHTLHTTKNGKTIPVEINSSLVNYRGEPAVLSIARDITQRIKAENTQKFLYEVSRFSIGQLSLRDYLAAIHQKLKKIMKADNFYIALYDKNTGKYTLPYHVDEQEDFATNEPITLDDSLTDHIRKTGKAKLVTEDIETELKKKEKIKLVGEPSPVWIGAPLIDSSSTEVIGVIALQDYRDKDAYSEDDLNTLNIIAASIGIFIERIKTLEKLKMSESRFKSFLNSTTDLVQLADENYKMLFVNNAMLKTLGIKEEDTLGKTVFDLFPAEIAGTCHETNKKARELGEIVKSEEVWGDGIFETLKFPVALGNDKTGVGALIRNITQKKKLDEQLLFLSRAVEQNPVAIVITNPDGNIRYVNPAFKKTTGFSPEEAIGKNPNILQSGHHSPEFYQELWDTLLSGKDWTGVFRNKKKNGKLYWEEAMISPILDERGAITHFVAVKEDITERKKLMEDLVEAKEKAEESDRLKSAFLANMSHEIRTPMNGIMGFLELLSDPDLSRDDRTTYLEVVNKSGDRLLNTINDIIELSKIESGQHEVSNTAVNISDLLNFHFDFFRHEAEKKGLTFKLANQIQDTKAQVFTDKNKLESILVNLIKNALKFTLQGHIELGCRSKNNQLTFWVDDSGPGIPQNRLTAIFERFVQADLNITRPHEGSGLGLSIAKEYATLLNGEISVESEPGKGSTFYFTLPCNNAGPANVEENEQNAEPVQTPQQNKNKKILIVEDDPDSFAYLEVVLSGLNYKISHAKNGSEAVEFCKKNPDTDLVLMDLKMPVMDGYEATGLIREFNREIPIIAQTAYALTGDKKLALDAGCNDYISKPIKKKDLLNRIDKYLS